MPGRDDPPEVTARHHALQGLAEIARARAVQWRQMAANARCDEDGRRYGLATARAYEDAADQLQRMPGAKL